MRTTTRDEEFRSFAAQRRPALLRTARLLAPGDACAAEDLVQITLERLNLAWPRVRTDGVRSGEGPEAYARRILVNAAVDEARRPWRRRRADLTEAPDVAAPPHPTGPDGQPHDERALVLAALADLPAGMRAAVAPAPPTATQVEDDIGRGRRALRRRRTRRGAALLAGAATVTLGGAVATRLPASAPVVLRPTAAAPAASRTAAPPRPAALPTATGRGPGAAAFTEHGYRPGVLVEGPSVSAADAAPVVGGTRTTLTTSDGTRGVVYVSKNAFFCFGDVPAGAVEPRRTSCTPLERLPAEGFWGVTTWNVIPGTSDTAKMKGPVVVAGLLRGPVTRVVVSTPDGDVEARTAPAARPGLGTLWWAPTGRTVDEEVRTPTTLRVTAYRGGTPVFAVTLPT